MNTNTCALFRKKFKHICAKKIFYVNLDNLNRILYYRTPSMKLIFDFLFLLILIPLRSFIIHSDLAYSDRNESKGWVFGLKLQAYDFPTHEDIEIKFPRTEYAIILIGNTNSISTIQECLILLWRLHSTKANASISGILWRIVEKCVARRLTLEFSTCSSRCPEFFLQ